jgi:predicted  nucleic acid-binding Zn-ribbon protein
LPFWVIDLQTEEIRILGRDELISAVIAKHEHMIADYSSEYDTLKSAAGGLDTEINDLKKRIEELEGKHEEHDEKISGKISVYDELKHRSGCDALNELEKLHLGTMESEKIEPRIKSL